MKIQLKKYEPSQIEIWLTKLSFLLFGKSVYKDFANRLPLSGKEWVLDYGCGMGTVAYFIAKKLSHGQLVCADISEKWLMSCKKTLHQYGNVQFQKIEKNHIALPYHFDIIYCHFVLHDLSKHELIFVIPYLVQCLKSGGQFIFREPLHETEKLSMIKQLFEKNNLSLKESRITDIPYMGNALESIYIKI